MMRPFEPLAASTKNIALALTSTTVQLINSPNNLTQVRVANNSSVTAFVEFGDSTITASLSTSIPIGAGVVEVLTVQCPAGPLNAAAIAGTATGNVYFTPGVGM